MPSATETLGYAAAGLLATEATGVTNFTGGDGDGGRSGPPGIGGLNLTLPGINLGGIDAPEVNLPERQGFGGIGEGLADLFAAQGETIQDLAGTVEETATETTETVTGTGETVVNVTEGGGSQIPGWLLDNTLSGGTRAENWNVGGGGGRGGSGGVVGVAGDAVSGAGNFGRHNPIFSSGLAMATPFAAVSPWVPPAGLAALGITAGAGVAEVGADTVTGQQTLFLGKSPLDVTNSGPWWQGPDAGPWANTTGIQDAIRPAPAPVVSAGGDGGGGGGLVGSPPTHSGEGERAGDRSTPTVGTTGRLGRFTGGGGGGGGGGGSTDTAGTGGMRELSAGTLDFRDSVSTDQTEAAGQHVRL